MPRNIPRIALSGLSGGAGKTMLSLGLARCLAGRGLKVKPFKKGPDYIDAVWLGLAASEKAVNLDQFFMQTETLRSLFWQSAAGFDFAVVEGNRGLFDGLDEEGTTSTADLARLLGLPVVLSLDCTKMTRTAAAVVQGVAGFEPGLNLAGVVLNRSAGERHRNVLVKSIERHTDVPVLGALPKIKPDPIPERHMGLISDREFSQAEEVLKKLAKVVEDHCDVEAIAGAARGAGVEERDLARLWPADVQAAGIRIGYVRDAALWFYYEENIEALRKAGAETVELSLLTGESWPEIHGLYLGGGFPETLAERLSENRAARDRVRSLAGAGMPVYAECGGLMFLGRSLKYGEREYPMSGVFDVTTELCERPQGLGYVEAEVVRENPFHPVGTTIKGHEFHYSCCLPENAPPPHELCLKLKRGSGMGGSSDGMLKGNAFAAYTHIHALGCPWWAGRFASAALNYKQPGERAG
jgi:cobyrinic acid a,c-diamide synthase